MIGASLVAASDFDVACIIGVFDTAIDIPAAEPLLRRPKVEGETSLFRQNRSNNDMHGGFLLKGIRTAVNQSAALPHGRDAVLDFVIIPHVRL